MTLLTKVGLYSFPLILMGVPLYAWLKGVPVYDTFIQGAEEGFKMSIGILPYLITIFVAVSCLRGSGALDLLAGWVLKLTGSSWLPADMLPLVLIRPISGSGALAITGELLTIHGPDSPLGLLASILQGATDTTFYVVSMYFGSVKIKKTKHALWAGLFGDLLGFLTGLYLWKRVIPR